MMGVARPVPGGRNLPPKFKPPSRLTYQFINSLTLP